MKKVALLMGVAFSLGLGSCTTISPITATNNSVGTKVGTASNTCIFTAGAAAAQAAPSVAGAGNGFNLISAGLCFNNGSYGIVDAAQNAGIERVGSVDLKTSWYVFFTKYELIVTGE